MSQKHVILGDWGTTNLRLFLYEDGKVIAHKDGPGIAQIQTSPEDAFFNLTQDWFTGHGQIPALLCGMVGSSIGWVETPYRPCPVGVDDLSGNLTQFHTRTTDVAIVAGVSCTNPIGGPDFMRGEETQILGTLQNHPDLKSGRHLICLPGTHAKWVLLENAYIKSFMTALTGELFAILRQHSVITKGATSGPCDDEGALLKGAKRSFASDGSNILNQLFEVRALQLKGDLLRDASPAYLSGLLIGLDVKGALATFQDFDTICIIGAPQISARYSAVLQALGHQARLLDGTKGAVSGLISIGKTAGII